MALKSKAIRSALARFCIALWGATLAIALMGVPQASHAQVTCAAEGGGATSAVAGTDGTSCGRNAGNTSDRSTSFGFASGAVAVGADNSAFGTGTGAYIGTSNSSFGARAGGILNIFGFNIGSFNTTIGAETGGSVNGGAKTPAG